jgi:integrase
MGAMRARGLPTHVMVQVREQLPRWRDPDGRFLTELMLGTGMRVGDACALGFDPVVLDADGHPYIHYWNHKMRREAFVPIERAMLIGIRHQQQRTAGATFTRDARFKGATFTADAEFGHTNFYRINMFGGAWVRRTDGARRSWPVLWALSATPGVPRPGAEGEWRQLVRVPVAAAEPEPGVTAAEQEPPLSVE